MRDRARGWYDVTSYPEWPQGKDPLTFGGIAALLLVLTLGAGYVDGRKGLNVDPMVALKYE